MNDDRILLRAARLVRSGKYCASIRLLEPEVVRYHDSFRYYYILASACLRSGDFGGALTYFRRGREIKMRDPSVLLGLAILYLRRGETDRVVDLCLEVLEKDPRHRKAGKILETVRKSGDPDILAAWLESGRISRLYPDLPSAPPSPLFYAALAALAATVAGAALLATVGAGLLNNPFASAVPDRTGMETVNLVEEDRARPVETGGSWRLVLTKAQVLETYETAQRLFRDYRDEAARFQLNRILDSNASAAIKAKASLLASFAAVPGFDTIKDKYEYVEVARDPAAFRDLHVVWRGMATNVREGEKTTSFDLLVGYDTRNSLQGIVPVAFDSALSVDPEKPLEVLGRLKLETRGMVLEGVAIHQARSLTAGTDVDGTGK